MPTYFTLKVKRSIYLIKLDIYKLVCLFKIMILSGDTLHACQKDGWIQGLVKSVQIRENIDQKKLHIWTHFTQCLS